MKKLLIFAMAALTLIACNKKDEPQPQPQTKLTLNETEISVAVAATFQLTANMEVTWSSSNPQIAGINEKGLVTGVAKGEATITAKAVNSNELASCKVTVTDGGVTPPPANPYAEFAQLQGSAYYVFFLQEGATKYLGDKVIYNFGPNDHPDEAQEGKRQGSRWLYLWGDQTFTGGTPVGTDPFDQAEGWTALVQNYGKGWAGAGLCIAINDGNNVSGEGVEADFAALNGIKEHITNYDEWYLAVGLKNSVQGAAYEFKLIGSNVFDASQDKGIESGVGTLTIAPAATGEWVYKEYKLSDIPGLEFGDFTTNGSNLLTIVATPYLEGTQLDLGYVFLYKK